MTRFNTRMLLLGALIVSALGVSALGAQAKTTPAKPATTVKGGTLTITPTTKTIGDLVSHQIVPKPVKPAKLVGTSIQAPVSGGRFDKKHTGVLVVKGKLQLVSPKSTLTFSHFTVVVTKGKSAVLDATLKGKTIKFADISGLMLMASGKKSETVMGEAHASKALAAAVNKLAGSHIAHAGEDIGSVKAALKLA